MAGSLQDMAGFRGLVWWEGHVSGAVALVAIACEREGAAFAAVMDGMAYSFLRKKGGRAQRAPSLFLNIHTPGADISINQR